jgi:hypothetical protein
MPLISNTEPAAAQASTKENPRSPYATGSAGLAITVRGSSRRIMIMRFRPANIRLINRRSTCSGCCSLCPREKASATTKNIPTDFAALTRSLYIRAMRSSRNHWSVFRVDCRRYGSNGIHSDNFGVARRPESCDRSEKHYPKPFCKHWPT